VAPPVDPVEELVLDVQPGDTLDSLFRQTSLSLVDLAEILQLDVARKYLRVLRPGDVLHVRHDGGSILALNRELDIRSKLEVQRGDGGFEANVVELPLEHRLVTIGGKIRSSLFEAAQESRVSEKLIMNMAQIFEYDIDFVRDIGEGDEFALVYEELWRDGTKLGEGEVLAAEFVNRGARYTAIRYDDGDGRASYYTHDGQPMRKAFVRAPLSFTRISSDFNPRRRHPILNTIRAHQGVDYSAPKGTPVKASGDGKIIFRGWKGGYGNTIILQRDHPLRAPFPLRQSQLRQPREAGRRHRLRRRHRAGHGTAPSLRVPEERRAPESPHGDPPERRAPPRPATHGIPDLRRAAPPAPRVADQHARRESPPPDAVSGSQPAVSSRNLKGLPACGVLAL
jgi:murein DD-endopeptidase MepM/ murein hydrolase activator NlpD